MNHYLGRLLSISRSKICNLHNVYSITSQLSDFRTLLRILSFPKTATTSKHSCIPQRLQNLAIKHERREVADNIYDISWENCVNASPLNHPARWESSLTFSSFPSNISTCRPDSNIRFTGDISMIREMHRRSSSPFIHWDRRCCLWEVADLHLSRFWGDYQPNCGWISTWERFSDIDTFNRSGFNKSWI